MPRQIIPFAKFTAGLITAVDKKDIPLEAASSSSDLDPISHLGKLAGRYEESDVSSPQVADTLAKNAIIPLADGTHNMLVYQDGAAGTGLRTNTDFLTGTDAASATGLGTIRSFDVRQNVCRVAGSSAYKWIGYIPYGSWGGADTGLTHMDCTLDRTGGLGATADIAFSSETAYAGGILPDDFYWYTICFEYDGFQYAPLPWVGLTAMRYVTVSTGVSTSGTDNSVSFRITLTGGTADLNPRVTAVIVFRTTDNVTWTKVGRIDTTGSAWGISGGDRYYNFIDTGYNDGETYDQLTGLSATMDVNTVQAGLAVSAGSYIVAARCSNTGLSANDEQQTLFRSLANRPDMFNWSEDYLKLPIVPNALVNFAGRLWVMDNTRLVKVNADAMFIEDVVVGVGAAGQNNVLVTEYGLFIADPFTVYWHNGQSISDIGAYISDVYSSWYTSAVTVAYSAKYRAVVFFKPGDSPTAYVFNLTYQRWDYWTFPNASNNAGIVQGLDGELYIPYNDTTDKVYKLGGSSSRRAWTFNSRDIDLNDPTQNKRWYDIDVTMDSGTTLTPQYATNGGSSFTGTNVPVGTLARSLRWRLVGAGTQIVASVGLIVRPLLNRSR